MSHAISVSVQQKQCSNFDSFESTNCRPSVGIRKIGKIGVKLWSPGCLALIVVTSTLAYLRPAYAQTNLVQDPGFEKQSNTEGAALVSPWSGQGPGQTYSDIGSAHSGSHDGSMQSNNGTSTVTSIVQTIPVTAGTNYTLSGWFTVASGSISSGEFGARTTAGAVIAQTAVSSSLTSYKQLTVTFSSGSNTSIVIFGGAILGASSILRMDDLSLSTSGASKLAISNVTPSIGPASGGIVVAINGSGFESGATVAFGSTKSSAVTFISSTQLKAMTPPEPAGTVSVTITNPGGGTATAANAFTYTTGPTISRISPTSGPMTGGTTVTITGTGFKSGATVIFGALFGLSVTFNSSTQLTAVTPAESAGAVNVVVTNTDGGTATDKNGFTYTAGSGGPTVTSVSPNPDTAGSTVAVWGSNFVSGANVQFGGNSSSSVSWVSPTQLNALVPSGSGTVNVTAINPGGLSGMLPNGFAYGSGSSGALLSGCTVNSSNVPSCKTPSGWTLVDAQGFESGSFNTGESAYSGSNSETINTATAHTGTHSLDTYVTHSYGGLGMILAGSQINSREVDVSWWEYLQQANSTYSVFYADFYQFTRSDSPPAAGLLFDWTPPYPGGWAGSTAQPSLFPVGQSGYPNFAVWGGFTNVIMGQWYQLEFHLKANDPGQNNGVSDFYVNGALIQHVDSSSKSSSCGNAGQSNCGNFVGSDPFLTVPINIGGDWGALIPGSNNNQSMTACKGGVVNGVTYTPQQACPPNGVIPYFHMYQDDVIVLKK